jgi:phospholipase C
MPAHDPIEHVVVLLLENHSFDQMLGSLSKVHLDLKGVDPAHPGVNYDADGKPYYQQATTERQVRLDPKHELVNVAAQLEGGNAGFVKDYCEAFAGNKDLNPQYIMGYYPLDFLPALHRLARDFTVCDQWFASVPGPTWANRFFALSGTALGRVLMPEGVAHLHVYDQDTVFDRLNDANVSWKVYFHDMPQSLVFTHQLEPRNAARYFPVHRFYKDARGSAERFPQFCLIEPRYSGIDQNDDHPPHDVMKAQQLVADVYNALRANADLWSRALLVVFYDEHGGFYDHVVPPEAKPPDDHREEYAFDQLGVRVPALLVSPWVGRGTWHTRFDHTSLLKYLAEKWSFAPLGARAADANNIGEAIRESVPRTDTVEKIELTADQQRPPDPQVEEEAAGVVNALHRSLILFGQHLKNLADLEAPRVLSHWARLIEWLRLAWVRLWKPFARRPNEFELVQAHVPKFLKVQKQKAVQELQQAAADPAAGEEDRQKAAKMLRTITGAE